MERAKPTVVPASAAAEARAFVFERRSDRGIDPYEAHARLVAAGHGSGLPSTVREKRLRTWVLQVLRRLRKYGWLGAPDPQGWPPTAALRECSDPAALAKRAPRLPETPASLPPESWEGFVHDWVFHHRLSEFRVGELAAALVQRGYGTGNLDERLDGARELAEEELLSLKRNGLLRHAARTEVWMPTELLRTWPDADS